MECGSPVKRKGSKLMTSTATGVEIITSLLAYTSVSFDLPGIAPNYAS